MAEEKKNQNIVDEEEKFFEDLLDDEDIEENDDIENDVKEDDGDDEKGDRSQKNRDAEEARKRREQEAKEKAEQEAREKEEKEKAEREAKEKEEREKAEKEKSKKTDQTSKLGEQLVDFKKKYPNVDLAELDNDKSFKRYIDGRLLGKKDFTELYEDYLEMKSELSGKSQDEVKRNYERKAKSSSGTATPRGDGNPTEIYSKDELEKITARLPYMSDAEANRVMEKFDKSVDFYKNKK